MKQLELIIKPVADGAKIIEVIHAAFKRYETDPIPTSALVETSTSIEQELQNGVCIFGAYLNGVLTGVVKVTECPDHLYFSRLAVLPAHQGKGIASMLVAYIEEFATEMKIPRLICIVRKSETGNLDFYRKRDFEILKEETKASPLGYMMTVVTMSKVNDSVCVI